jgi:hypothetical protein
MDPSGSLATWGNFLTAHGAIFQQCSGLMGAEACAAIAGGLLLTDDSDHDMDPSCLADYNPADLTTLLDCSGRMIMNFDIPCVPIIEAREVVAEFVSVGGDECGTGDMNGDGSNNVLDVVALVTCVLSNNCEGCTGDMNGDGSHNVLDVVALVTCVLSNDCNSSARADNATSINGAKSAEFKVVGNEVTMTADGDVVAVQMTLSHGNDFAPLIDVALSALAEELQSFDNTQVTRATTSSTLCEPSPFISPVQPSQLLDNTQVTRATTSSTLLEPSPFISPVPHSSPPTETNSATTSRASIIGTHGISKFIIIRPEQSKSVVKSAGL